MSSSTPTSSTMSDKGSESSLRGLGRRTESGSGRKATIQKLKQAKRRAVQGVLETVNLSTGREVKDGRYDAMKKSFTRMIDDLDQVGAGLSLHLAWTNRWYKNSSNLALVLSEKNRMAHNENVSEEESILGKSGFKAAIDASKSRWAYLHATVRRSMNAVVVNRALDPLRVFVGGTAKEVRKACEERDGAAVDVNSYTRRKDAPKKQIATDLYQELNTNALEDLRKAKIARDVVVRDVCLVVLAAQAELFCLAADYVEETADAFADDCGGIRVEQFRKEMRDLMETGGPELVTEKKNALQTTFALATGKTTYAELRQQEARQKERERLQREAQLQAQYQPMPQNDAEIFEHDRDQYAQDEQILVQESHSTKTELGQTPPPPSRPADIPPPPPPLRPDEIPQPAETDYETQEKAQVPFGIRPPPANYGQGEYRGEMLPKLGLAVAEEEAAIVRSSTS